MSRSSEYIYRLTPRQIVIAPGATLAFFMDVQAGQLATTIKYYGGGTLEILDAQGSTLSGATLAALSGTGYLVGSSEILNIGGPARFYLSATGATTTVMALLGKTSGV